MRRDERPYDPAEGRDEIAAIESQWTEVWKKLGGPQKDYGSIVGREEFRIMRSCIESLPKGSRLLDGGCGLGEWVVYWTLAGYPTLGLDISRATIEKLKSMFPDMQFAAGDIRETGLPNDSVDAYFSWGTFEHFEEGFDRVVPEAFRVLKPGGLLFVSTPFDNMRHALSAILSDPWRLSPKKQRTRFYQWRLTRGELATILARNGFAVTDVKIIYKRQGMARWLQTRFGISGSSFAGRLLGAILPPIVPAVLFGHMILAVAQKPR